VPPWGDDGWSRLDRDAALDSALAAYYEGLALRAEHPSYALIAFVSALEAMGSKSHELTRCTACGSTLGAGERFRESLRLVRSEPQAEALARAYRPRSKTAHAGQLFGTESQFGGIAFPKTFTSEPTFDFSFRTLEDMRLASRDVLLRELARGA
jgi:hypothetical protein